MSWLPLAIMRRISRYYNNILRFPSALETDTKIRVLMQWKMLSVLK
jgi:hypothetical protein